MPHLNRKISLLVLVIFIVSLFVLLGAVVLLKVYDSSNISFSKALLSNIGDNWGKYHAFNTNPAYEVVKVVSDGVYIKEPYNINIENSGTLKVILSTKGYYFNSEGKLTSIRVPLVIRLNENLLFYYENWQFKNITDQEALSNLPSDDQLLRDNWRLGGKKGQVLLLYFYDDYIESYKINGISPDYNENSLLLIGVVQKYFNENKETVKNFLKTGNTKINLVPFVINGEMSNISY